MACTDSAASVHILAMAKKKDANVKTLLCIICSGGAADSNGAYTVCALCELNDIAVEPAAA